ncbi:MAG: hypothetical protein GXO75_04935 [Calditrichaeota bacterium]|nr:hypothetical protein [Calditrichota bacterium]
MQRRNRKKENVIGQRYGYLTIIEDAEPYITRKDRVKRQVWVRCDCGNEKIARLDLLRSGQTKSCGCIGTRPDPNNPPRRRQVKAEWQRGFRQKNNSLCTELMMQKQKKKKRSGYVLRRINGEDVWVPADEVIAEARRKEEMTIGRVMPMPAIVGQPTKKK